VPLPLGLEGVVVPLGEVLLGGGVVLLGGGVDGEVVVGGEADGVRSPGRSPTRSPGDSVQAVSSPAPSARAQKPVSILFIVEASSCGGCVNDPQQVQHPCRRPSP
jgi:hypothetical protein